LRERERVKERRERKTEDRQTDKVSERQRGDRMGQREERRCIRGESVRECEREGVNERER